MKPEKKLKKQYFKLEIDKVIYPASVLSRVGARLIDFLIIWIPAFLITSIYVPLSTESTGSTTDFINTVPGQYDPVLMFAWSFTVVFAIVMLVVFPYFNKKNPGQTLGKKLFSLTPLYLGKGKEKLAYIYRELPILILFILPGIFELILGYDSQAFYLQYTSYLRNNGSVADDSQFPQMFEFFSDFWGGTDPNGVLDPSQHISTFGVSMAYLQVIMSMVFLFVIFVLWISMIIENQKRGYHDMISKTAVVNLKTITSLENAERMYNELVGNFTSVVNEEIHEEAITLDTEIPQEENSEIVNKVEEENLQTEVKVEEEILQTDIKIDEESTNVQEEVEKPIKKATSPKESTAKKPTSSKSKKSTTPKESGTTKKTTPSKSKKSTTTKESSTTKEEQ